MAMTGLVGEGFGWLIGRGEGAYLGATCANIPMSSHMTRWREEKLKTPEKNGDCQENNFTGRGRQEMWSIVLLDLLTAAS